MITFQPERISSLDFFEFFKSLANLDFSTKSQQLLTQDSGAIMVGDYFTHIVNNDFNHEINFKGEADPNKYTFPFPKEFVDLLVEALRFSFLKLFDKSAAHFSGKIEEEPIKLSFLSLTARFSTHENRFPYHISSSKILKLGAKEHNHSQNHHNGDYPTDHRELFNSLDFCFTLMKTINGHFEIDGLSNQVLVELPVIRIKNHPSFLETIIDAIQSKMNEDDFNIDELAHQFFLSRSTLSRRVKKECGLSVLDLILHIKMQKAEHLLLNSGMSVTEIAEESGFHSVSYFNQAFRKKHACTPTSFRNTKHKI